jgi:hypothetical protein
MTTSSMGKVTSSPSSRVLIDFHASGEGPQCHETLHQVVVPELGLDGVGVARASPCKDLLKMVQGWPRPMLDVVCNLHDALSTEATCSLLDAAIILSCSLLAALFAPLLVIPGTPLSLLGGDVGRRSSTAARGWAKLGRLGADGVMGDDAALFLCGVLEGIGQCLGGSQQWPTMHTALRHPCQ